MKNDSDETLLIKYRSGNAAAFDALYSRYRLPVYNYIFRQLKQDRLSEDIFQDVWMRVINSADQCDTDKAFAPWLYRIAHNRLVDYFRQQQPVELDLDNEKAGANKTPEHTAFIQNCIERLKKLLNLLKPEQRDAFILQQESGLSLEQIAQVMATGRETIKSRLRYTMQKLRVGLEGCDES